MMCSQMLATPFNTWNKNYNDCSDCWKTKIIVSSLPAQRIQSHTKNLDTLWRHQNRVPTVPTLPYPNAYEPYIPGPSTSRQPPVIYKTFSTRAVHDLPLSFPGPQERIKMCWHIAFFFHSDSVKSPTLSMIGRLVFRPLPFDISNAPCMPTAHCKAFQSVAWERSLVRWSLQSHADKNLIWWVTLHQIWCLADQSDRTDDPASSPSLSS